MNLRERCRLLVGCVVVPLLVVLGCYLYLSHNLSQPKYVHLSFDDVCVCMRDLSQDSTAYDSLFDQPFFGSLRDLHGAYGCKFSLYLFAEDGEFDLSQVPVRYKGEFEANSDWLKFGYHISYNVRHASQLSDDTILKDYDFCHAQVERFASPKSLSNTIRLHNFYANDSIVAAIQKRGIGTLLAADDDRLSYNLDTVQNKTLLRDGRLLHNCMQYLQTDIRLESSRFPAWDAFTTLREKDTLVVFTHEPIYDRTSHKLRRTVRLLGRFRSVVYL